VQTLGRYRLERLLGAGAFGEVHLGTLAGPMGFAKSVAIKVLARDRPGVDPVKLGTFVNEALLGENLHHPNIVAIHEFGEDRGLYFLVMEYIDGINLREVASLCVGRGVVMPPDAVCELGVQVCAGLQHAHEATDRDGQPLLLVHRDLKPANLLLDRTGTVRIGDFGVARAALNPFFTTTAGEVKGTPRYMAPEQVAGEAALTGAVDQYSLGLVLCELATGEPVFAADRLEELLHRVLGSDTSDAEERLAAVAPALSPDVGRALAAAPDERYASVGEMGAALRQIWLGLGGLPRMEVVAAATLGLRPGRGSGIGTAAQTAEVPAVVEADEEAGPWPRFTGAFRDQLGEEALAEVGETGKPAAEADGDEDDSPTSPPMPLIAAAVAAAVIAFAVFVWSFEPGGPLFAEAPIPDGETATEASAVATPAEQPPQPLPDQDGAASQTSPVELPVEPPPPAPAGPGWFKVNSTPWSEVWVDGRRIGETGEPSFEVMAGPRTVRLVRGDEQHTVSVQVPLGATVDLGCWDFRTGSACGE
jgi:eukaryotic-like serine/threonine-protein kinase